MKSKTENPKEFHSVIFFRKIKEEIAGKLEGKSFLEQKEFIRKVLTGEIKLEISE
jgi:hypothetical protein